jgi:KDO2-lipid IV(A) lauroyltransferase
MRIHQVSASGLGLPLAMFLARVLPERAMLKLARNLADRAALEDSPSARAVRRNQAVARNLDLSDPALDRAVQAVFRSAGRGYVALFRAMARGKQDLLRACEVSPELIARMEIALARGRGLILVGPHISAFDFFLLTVGARGYSGLALSPPMPTSTYRLQNRLRTQYGTETTPVSVESLRRAIKRLKAGGLVMTGLDRPIPEPEGLNFFGRPTYLPLGYARLAVRTGAPLLPGAVIPIGPGRYRTIAGDLISPPPAGSEDAARQLAQLALDQIEPLVREYLDEWLMFFPVWVGT